MRLQSETVENGYSNGIHINYNTGDAVKRLLRCYVFEKDLETLYRDRTS